jgi:cytochrome c
LREDKNLQYETAKLCPDRLFLGTNRSNYNMKQLICLSILAGGLCMMSCSDDASKSTPKKTTSSLTTPSAPVEEPGKVYDHPDYKKGLELAAKSDCWSCHKINEPSIGPSYSDVAARYEPTATNYELLASKIINGGKGVWGEVPMNAHPDISKEDAIAITKYILLLKPSK